MRKAWAIVDIGDVIVGKPFDTEEAAQATLEGMSYFGEMCDVREIDYNDEPLDEEGEELKAQFLKLMENTTHLHISKGIGFYALSYKERLRMLINTFTDTDAVRSSKAPASDVEVVNVIDLSKKMGWNG